MSLDQTPDWLDAGPRRKRSTAAIRFLWLVATLIMLAVVGWIGFNAYTPNLLRIATAPNARFDPSKAARQPDYGYADGWLAHPFYARAAARDSPNGYRAAPRPSATLFYLGPDSYFGNSSWNDPLDDAGANMRAAEAVRNEASAFNGVASIFAPRIRQATLGAQLVDRISAAEAIDLAYGDALKSFDEYLRSHKPGQPLFLVGSGQGAIHVLRLLQQRVAGKPLARDLVAAYLTGWPVTRSDADALGLPVCLSPNQSGCIAAWRSYGPTSDAKAVAAVRRWLAAPGRSRPSPMLCFNPLTGSEQPAQADGNIGSLAFRAAGELLGDLAPAQVGAACRDGLLRLEPEPKAPFIARARPDANYTAYDITLFWANVRADAERRLGAFATAQVSP